MNHLNKIALITGGSKGIGQAICSYLAKQNIYVIGTATTEVGVQSINNSLKGCNVAGQGILLELTDDKSIENLAKDLTQQSKMPDILINNAGITADNLLLRMKVDEWHRVMEVNLNAVFKLTQICLKNMLRKRWGRIVSIGSVVGLSGNPGQTNYCASKAAIIGFSKALAQEIASRNITVNVIAPGFIETEMTAVLSNSMKTSLLAKIPSGDFGKPHDIAGAVNFLVSEEARYITGQTIHVNGGMFMN